MAGSDSDSALGKLAGATVGQEISCSKLDALLETTNCSCQMNGVVKEETTYTNHYYKSRLRLLKKINKQIQNNSVQSAIIKAYQKYTQRLKTTIPYRKVNKLCEKSL